MGVFKYKAMNQRNQFVHGVLSCNSQTSIQLDEELAGQGLRLIQYKELKVLPYKQLNSRHLYNLWLSLRYYLLSGISFTEALKQLVENTPDQKLQVLLQVVYQKVCQGERFSSALEPYIESNTVVIPLLKTAEKTGNYLDVLTDLEAYASWNENLKSEVKNVLTYPSIVFGALWIAMFCILYFFAPQLKDYLKDLQGEVPGFTVLLLNLSSVVVGWPVTWVLLPIYIGICVCGVMRMFPVVKSVFLYLPGIKGLILKYHYVLLSKSLSLYLTNGYTVVEALGHLKAHYSNASMRKILEEVFQSVSKGISIAASFNRYPKIFSGFFLQMVGVGERSNTLGENFKVIGAYYEQDLKHSTRTLTKLLEPLILLVMGVFLIAVIVGLFYPLYYQVGASLGNSGGL
jgi:type II secretory pathway component PulF